MESEELKGGVVLKNPSGDTVQVLELHDTGIYLVQLNSDKRRRTLMAVEEMLAFGYRIKEKEGKQE